MPKRRERLSYFKFFVADWKELRDRGVSIATRGVWIELLAEMLNADERGTISGTVTQLARRIRCTPKRLQRALEELKKARVGTIQWCSVEPSVNGQRTLTEPSLNAQWSSTERSMEGQRSPNDVFECTLVTIESGRMKGEAEHYLRHRGDNRLRQSRHRAQAGVSGSSEAAVEEPCHALLTHTYPYPDPYPDPKREKDPRCVLSLDKLKEAFEPLYQQYPKPLDRDGSFEAFTRSVRTREELEEIRVAQSKYVAHKRHRNEYVHNDVTFYAGVWKQYVTIRPPPGAPVVERRLTREEQQALDEKRRRRKQRDRREVYEDYRQNLAKEGIDATGMTDKELTEFAARRIGLHKTDGAKEVVERCVRSIRSPPEAV